MQVVVYSVIVFVLLGTGHGAVAIPVALTDDVWTNTVGGKASSVQACDKIMLLPLTGKSCLVWGFVLQYCCCPQCRTLCTHLHVWLWVGLVCGTS